MKTKSLMPGIFALIFALSSAFVSVAVVGPNDQHVNDPPIGARDIMDVDCGSGDLDCKVQIQGGSSNPYQVYTDQTLEVKVLGSAQEPIPTVFEP